MLKRFLLSAAILLAVFAGTIPLSLAQDMAALRSEHASAIDNLSTFKTIGLQRPAIDGWLETGEGQQFLAQLRAADPAARADTIYARAVEQLASGDELPTVWLIDVPLLMVVPHGQSVSPYSPYFTTIGQLQGSDECDSLADCFGLPLRSEAPLYDVYQVKPNGTVSVFVSSVAPTEELGGLVRRKGGGLQYLLPNRKLWSTPVLIGTIAN